METQRGSVMCLGSQSIRGRIWTTSICWAHVPDTVLCHRTHQCTSECVWHRKERLEWIEGKRKKKSTKTWKYAYTQMKDKERREKMEKKEVAEVDGGRRQQATSSRAARSWWPGQRKAVPIPFSPPCVWASSCGRCLLAFEGSSWDSVWLWPKLTGVSLGPRPARELHLKPASCPGWS